jgi:hypothetical protein
MDRLSLSTFPHVQTRLGGGGSGKKVLLFVSQMWRHPRMHVFGCVLLELA